MKILTAKLKDLTARSAKGASNNKLLPLTSLVKICASEGILTLCTTDGTNYLYMNEKIGNEESFYAVVVASLFFELIQKTTSEYTELVLLDSFLKVVGSGTYKIALVTDEGTVVSYPDPVKKKKLLNTSAGYEWHPVRKEVLEKMDKYLRPALAGEAFPYYSMYYSGSVEGIGNVLLATDSEIVVCETGDILPINQPVLLSLDLIKIALVIADDTLQMCCSGNECCLKSEKGVVYGKIFTNVEEYAITDISTLLNAKYEASCEINRAALIAAVSRLSILGSVYHQDNLSMKFLIDGFSVLLSLEGQEGIETLSSKRFFGSREFFCVINIKSLLKALASCSDDTVVVNYGLQNMIAFKGRSFIVIVSLVEDQIDS